MAYVVDEWPTEQRVERAEYDWEQLFDGQIWVLVAGVDAQSKPESIRSAVAHQARRRELDVDCKVIGNKVYLQKQERNGDSAGR